MKEKKEKKTQIGGQAVIEGVMMRGKTACATAVRDEDGIIRVEAKRIKPQAKKNRFLRLPIIRGVVSFIDSMVSGTKSLMRSAEVFGEGEPSKFEKWVADKLKVNVIGVVSTISVMLGLVLAVFLFIFLPQTVRGGIEALVGNGFAFSPWAKNFIEGGLKLLIFVGYILLCTLLKDIRRTFMYHGAEHKTITCHEKGLELTVENAKKCRRVHDRCGTTFIVFVMLISILLFACFEAILVSNGVELSGLVRFLCKIAFLPIIAGLSYELLKALSKTDSILVFPLKIPGLLLQKITTREPDDKMLEVAITAFKTVQEMDADEKIPEKEFVLPSKRKELLERITLRLKDNGIDELAEAEWILSLTLNVKRDELNTDDYVKAKFVDRVNKLVDERISGRPLWYCIGDTDFYGYTIKVDERVLIPRPETEVLVENALKTINKDSKVLDLCTGSGAIAIAVKKESDATVYAVDVSKDAIDVASNNAKLNDADITFIESDLFSGVCEKDFDVIISNPPYIKSSEISTLQVEVKDFEPILALDGGNDGLDFYRIICEKAKDYLKKGGVLLLECGEEQASAIKELLIGYQSVEIIKDLEKVDRIVKAVL